MRSSSHPDFKLPSRGSISGRASSITAAFYQAITPVIVPSEIEVDEALDILGMSRGACRCAYCGDAHTEWDHFRPTVVGRLPTGYITEIANLVPACGKCNQSKGNKDWRIWMLGSAERAPARRGVPEVQEKVECLARFEAWRMPVRIDYVALLEHDWGGYRARLDAAVGHLRDAESVAKMLRTRIEEELSNRTKG